MKHLGDISKINGAEIEYRVPIEQGKDEEEE